ncbi:hypothetical protein H8356DRAFT_1437263 [Neocallimastix lanati (nom. inval.)]|nr:hypothetical protein H8356DRAFT_1437263 [Neocallimastix sp. JGI-2020a]
MDSKVLVYNTNCYYTELSREWLIDYDITIDYNKNINFRYTENSTNSAYQKLVEISGMCCVKSTGSLRSTSSGKLTMNDWFCREGVVTIENKFSYIITAAEDVIIPSLREEQVRLNRVPTLDVLPLSKRSIGEKIKKIDKLRQLKRIIIEPNETVFDFNIRYLELYDQLETQDKTKVPDLRTSSNGRNQNERSLYDYNNYSSIKQPIVTSINSTNNSWNKNVMNFKNLRNTSINMPSNAINKVNYNISNNYNNQDHNFSNYINSPKNYFTTTRRSKDDRYASLIKAKGNFKNNNNNNIDINNINII